MSKFGVAFLLGERSIALSCKGMLCLTIESRALWEVAATKTLLLGPCGPACPSARPRGPNTHSPAHWARSLAHVRPSASASARCVCSFIDLFFLASDAGRARPPRPPFAWRPRASVKEERRALKARERERERESQIDKGDENGPTGFCSSFFVGLLLHWRLLWLAAEPCKKFGKGFLPPVFCAGLFGLNAYN